MSLQRSPEHKNRLFFVLQNFYYLINKNAVVSPAVAHNIVFFQLKVLYIIKTADAHIFKHDISSIKPCIIGMNGAGKIALVRKFPRYTADFVVLFIKIGGIGYLPLGQKKI